MFTPLILRLNMSPILKEISILPKELMTHTNIPEEADKFPLINSFADDTNIALNLTCDENGKSPRVEEILKLYKHFQGVGNLLLNNGKTSLFSAINSNTINRMSEYYEWEKETHKTKGHLGH